MEKHSDAVLRFQVLDGMAMERLGGFLGSLLQPGDLVCLIGDLGAGKTTLVRGMARGLGFSGRVTSPTFTLMNRYDCTPPIVHMDFYRLDSAAMMDDLGLEDYLHRDAIMLIEWPQVGLEALPAPQMKIEIALIEDDYDLGRTLTVSVPASRRDAIERLQNYVDTCH